MGSSSATLWEWWDWAYYYLWLTALVSCVWVPIVLAGYSIGRRRIGVRSVLVFIAIEGVATALSLYLYRQLQAEMPQY